MRSPRSFHPLLLAAVPILSLVDVNLDSIEITDFPRALVVTLVAVLGLQLLLNWRLRDPVKAGLILSLGMVFFLAAQPGVDLLVNLLPVGLSFVATPIVLMLATLFFVLGARFILRTPRDLRSFTALLNIGFLGLLALPIVHIGHRIVVDLERPNVVQERQVGRGLEPPTLKRPSEPPDIYFILLDAYPRADVLEEFYGLDNSAFIDYLRRSDFLVADLASSNYMMTLLELPSLTNLGYLDELGIAEVEDPVERGVPSDLLPNNRVVTALREIGYQTVNISTGFERAGIEDAEISLSIEAPWWTLNELERFLASMTILGPIADLVLDSQSAYFSLHRRRVLNAFEQLERMPDLPGPKLVWAHIQTPHQPFVFDAEGEDLALDFDIYQPVNREKRRALRSAFAQQVLHTNALVERTLNTILSESSTDPVIIIQGDHGLRLSFDRDPEKTCYRELFGILNAIRLPNGEVSAAFSSSTSPVNTFRVVFDHIFGTELGLLPDRSFFAHRIRSWNFLEITDEISSCSAPPSDWAPSAE